MSKPEKKKEEAWNPSDDDIYRAMYSMALFVGHLRPTLIVRKVYEGTADIVPGFLFGDIVLEDMGHRNNKVTVTPSTDAIKLALKMAI